MEPLFHTLLIEPEAERAHLLTSMFGALGAVVTHARDVTHARRLLGLLQPDLLVVGVEPATAPALAAWLTALLATTPLRILLYAEHPLLLEIITLDLPLRVCTIGWPCSQHELAYLAAPLLAQGQAGAGGGVPSSGPAAR